MRIETAVNDLRQLITHFVGLTALGTCILMLGFVTLTIAYILINNLIGSAVGRLRMLSVRETPAIGLGQSEWPSPLAREAPKIDDNSAGPQSHM